MTASGGTEACTVPNCTSCPDTAGTCESCVATGYNLDAKANSCYTVSACHCGLGWSRAFWL